MLQQIIPRRSQLCCKHRGPLSPGSEYISVLVEEGENLVRRDYCLACFESEKRPSESHWRGKIPLKPEKKRDPEAVALFRELVAERNDPARLFLLALYLERKKELVRRPEVKEKNKALLYFELLETGEIFSIQSTPLTPHAGVQLFAS